MRTMPSMRLSVPAMFLLLALAIGCGETIEPGDLTEETRILDLDGAERVSAKIEMNLGKMNVSGGAREMLDAGFVYNVKDWKPIVEYGVSDDVGRLVIKQPKTKGKSFAHGFKYEWDLRFGDEVPLDIAMEVGAGECRMDLAGLPVSSLDLTFGAGDVDIVVGGSETLEKLDLEAGAGDIALDLTGDWDVDLDGRIKAGVGRVTIDLPEDVGVRIETSKGIGKVGMSGLRRKGDYYVNAAYGKSDKELRIRVEAGIGAIELRVGGREEEGVTI
jgi:hypothetical protein